MLLEPVRKSHVALEHDRVETKMHLHKRKAGRHKNLWVRNEHSVLEPGSYQVLGYRDSWPQSQRLSPATISFIFIRRFRLARSYSSSFMVM